MSWPLPKSMFYDTQRHKDVFPIESNLVIESGKVQLRLLNDFILCPTFWTTNNHISDHYIFQKYLLKM